MEYLNTTKSDVSTNVAHDFIGAWDLVRDKKTQPYVMVVDANFIKNQTNLTIDDGYNFSTVNGLKRDHKYYDLGESGYAIHGFSVASVIGATTNNNIGIAGGSTDVKIMALKALHDGHCSGFDIADAVRYASGDTHFDRINTPILPILTSKPDVINISAGTSYPEGTPIEQSKCSNFMQSALDMAFDAGISVVVSAGNSTQQIALITPANCNHVITVTALDKTGDIAYYSNYGKGATIIAQGSEVMAYDLNFYTRDVVFELMFGTSLSAPLVTSAVALAKKANPNLTPTQVKKLLMLSSDNYRHVTGAWRVIDVEKTYKCEQLNCGAGILNAKRLVEMALLYKQGKVDKITHAVTDNMGCKDKWLFDNVGDKLKLCQLYKITFVVDTLSTKYSLHRSPIGVAFDDTSEKVLITQEGEVYSADIDADTFN